MVRGARRGGRAALTILLAAVGAQACGSFVAGEVEDITPEPRRDAGVDGDSRPGSDAAPIDSGTLGEDAGTSLDAAAEADADAGSPACNGDASCERLVFVTNATFTGNLGGAAGADAKCDAAAKASARADVRARTFKAWVSTATEDAIDRVTNGQAAYRRTDGALVAPNLAGFLTGLVNPIDRNENGDEVSAEVWTGTQNDGRKNNHCLSWTSTSLDHVGKRGSSKATTSAWTDSAAPTCNQQGRLYCFEY